MAPEGQGPRSFWIRIWDPKRWPTPTKSWVPCNFCFIKFLPKRTVESPEAPRTLFTHPVPGGGYQVKKNPRTFPLEDHICAKFRPDLSSRLDFYRDKQTHRHPHPHCPLCIRYGPNRPLFEYFPYFLNTMTNTVQNLSICRKIIVGVLCSNPGRQDGRRKRFH